MNAAYNQHTADLRKAIDRYKAEFIFENVDSYCFLNHSRRNSLLMLQRGSKHQRIRLTGADLTVCR